MVGGIGMGRKEEEERKSGKAKVMVYALGCEWWWNRWWNRWVEWIAWETDERKVTN